jgi:uncharacterized protein (TIGR00251 family)
MNDKGSKGSVPKKLLTVRVHPGARKVKVETLGPAELKVHVAAPPERGAANREVAAALADHFGLPVSRVRIVRGEHSRIKRVALESGG